MRPGDAGWVCTDLFHRQPAARRGLDISASERAYVNWALAWGNANQWLIGPEITGSSAANTFCCGQTYIDLYLPLDPEPLLLTKHHQ